MNQKSLPTSPQSTYASWHENPSEKQVLLNLINTEGFILEDAIDELLSTFRQGMTIHRGEIFEKAPHRENIRPEIDLWIQSGNYIFLLESKKSIYDWIFLQNQDSPKDVHLITGPNKMVSTHNRTIKNIDCVSKQALEILPEDDKLALRRQDHKKKNRNIPLPIRSDREDFIHAAVRQTLFNLEMLIHCPSQGNTWRGNSHRIFVPVIVTNTFLFSCSYSQKDINEQADLTKMILNPISVAAFNHSEILRHGTAYEEIIEHIGQPAWGNRLVEDTRFKGSHNKTVFIVNKSNLLNFIDNITNTQVAGNYLK